MFNTKQKNFGVIKSEGYSVKIYESQTQYCTISLGQGVVDARWAGDSVIVYLADGKVRKYTSISQYYTV